MRLVRLSSVSQVPEHFASFSRDQFVISVEKKSDIRRTHKYAMKDTALFPNTDTWISLFLCLIKSSFSSISCCRPTFSLKIKMQFYHSIFRQTKTRNVDRTRPPDIRAVGRIRCTNTWLQRGQRASMEVPWSGYRPYGTILAFPGPRFLSLFCRVLLWLRSPRLMGLRSLARIPENCKMQEARSRFDKHEESAHNSHAQRCSWFTSLAVSSAVVVGHKVLQPQKWLQRDYHTWVQLRNMRKDRGESPPRPSSPASE